MTKELGEIVVGWEGPKDHGLVSTLGSCLPGCRRNWAIKRGSTLGNLLSLVDLGDFLLKKIIALLAYLYNLAASSTPSYDRQ